MDKVIQEIRDMMKLWDVLISDLDYARNIVEDKINCIKTNYPQMGDEEILTRLQLSLRIMIRNEITAIEGFCFTAKKLGLHLCEFNKIILTEKECEDVLEKKIDKSGKEKNFHLSRKTNIKCAFRILHRSIRSKFAITDQVNWKKLCATVDMRNRITHPKKLADLSITAADYLDAVDGFGWFGKNVGEIKEKFSTFLS